MYLNITFTCILSRGGCFSLHICQNHNNSPLGMCFFFRTISSKYNLFWWSSQTWHLGARIDPYSQYIIWYGIISRSWILDPATSIRLTSQEIPSSFPLVKDQKSTHQYGPHSWWTDLVKGRPSKDQWTLGWIFFCLDWKRSGGFYEVLFVDLDGFMLAWF